MIKLFGTLEKAPPGLKKIEPSQNSKLLRSCKKTCANAAENAAVGSASAEGAKPRAFAAESGAVRGAAASAREHFADLRELAARARARSLHLDGAVSKSRGNSSLKRYS